MINYMQHPQWNTPLIKLAGSKERYGATVYAKLETMNPTGTHKDRGSAMIVLDMLQNGYDTAVCASTGNAGLSLSAFMYMHALKAKIILSNNVQGEKLAHIKLFNPELRIVQGDYLTAVHEALAIAEKHKFYNANAGYCRAKVLGDAYIGREIAPLLPDVVVCPTNNGTLLIGVWEGLKSAGIIPRMIASTTQATEIASSTYGAYQLENPRLSQAIDASGGEFASVSDQELAEETAFLASQGIFAEPSSAAATAALYHTSLTETDTVICVITGSALRYPTQMRAALQYR